MNPDNQRGIALLWVLFTLALGMLILALALPMADTLYDRAFTQCDRIRNYYACESAAARIQLLLANDCTACTDRGTLSVLLSNDLRQTFDNTLNEFSQGRFHTLRPNGRLQWKAGDTHYEAAFTLLDGMINDTLQLSASELLERYTLYAKAYSDDADRNELLSRLKAQLNDYLDEDDNADLSGHGLEKSEYKNSLNLVNLPRNAPMVYPEEGVWIPELRKNWLAFDRNGFLANIRPGLPPKLKTQFASLLTGNPALPGSDSAFVLLRLKSNLADETTERKLFNAIEKFNAGEASLSQMLDETESAPLKSIFRTEESGLYLLRITAKSADHPSPRTLTIGFVLRASDKADAFTVMLHRTLSRVE